MMASIMFSSLKPVPIKSMGLMIRVMDLVAADLWGHSQVVVVAEPTRSTAVI
jgi:hypothetical protein